MSDKESLKPLIESLIFASEGALSLERLSNVLDGEAKADIKGAVEELMEEYRTSGRGILIEEVAGGYQFRTNPDSSPWLRKLFKIGLQRISKAAMESLAVIAYKQPVTRGEIEAVRGVDSGGVLATLMEKRFIKITGRKEVPGRPVVYGTTREFLETFDLKDLSCLPSLKDIQRMEEEHALETAGLEGEPESPVEDTVQDQAENSSAVKDDVQEDVPAEAGGEEPEDGQDNSGGDVPEGDQAEEDTEDDPFEGDFDDKNGSPGGRREASEDNSLGGDNFTEEGRGADAPGEGDGKREDDN